jgi:hypothetical protein
MSSDANLFLSSYINAEMLEQYAPVAVTVREVIIEKFGREGEKELKPVVYFEEEDNPIPGKGLSLNKSNLKTLIALAGTSKMDEWAGLKVTLVVQPTMYKGKQTKGVRIEKGA